MGECYSHYKGVCRRRLMPTRLGAGAYQIVSTTAMRSEMVTDDSRSFTPPDT
jgi:hypothetical protein